MASLTDATAWLLKRNDIVEQLRLADKYMTLHQQLGSTFVLPAAHAGLAPLIEAYSGRLAQWLAYIRAVRDALSPRSDAAAEVHEWYRTVNVRLTQQERRARAARAMRWLSHNHPKLTTAERDAWLAKVEKHWTAQRMKSLAAARRAQGGPLSLHEQAVELEKFWSYVDEEITRGDLPTPETVK